MAPRSNRHEFSAATKTLLAKRSAYQCAICRAVTIGPSTVSELAINNVGKACHIYAAAPDGPRPNKLLTEADRRSITNAIWLCGTHATLIDNDVAEWTAERLIEIKQAHESRVRGLIGVPTHVINGSLGMERNKNAIHITEYAFGVVGTFIEAYASVLTPMLKDKQLADGAEIGLLLCGEREGTGDDIPWTVFVKPEWLRWFIAGADFKTTIQVPHEVIYGQMPAWPDTFFEFLAAIVMSKCPFAWQRHPGGYLMLSQPSRNDDLSRRSGIGFASGCL